MHVAVQQHRPVRVVRGGPARPRRPAPPRPPAPSRAGRAGPRTPARSRPAWPPTRLRSAARCPGAGRHSRIATRQRISCRCSIGRPTRYIDGPSRSSSIAPDSSSCRSSRTQPSPPASRSTVISSAACRPWWRWISSLTTAGVPSASSAGATNASVASSYAGPTVSRQSRSSRSTRSGSPASQPSAPAARANARTVAGTSTLATGPSHRPGPPRFHRGGGIRARDQSRSASSRGGPGGAVAGDRQVVDLPAELTDDRGGQPVRVGGVGVVEAVAGAVPLQPVPDVEVLLEVVAQRDVDERAAVGGQLHAGGQPALDQRDVAGGQVLVQVRQVAADGQAAPAGQRRRVDARAGDHDEAQVRGQPPGQRHGVGDPAQQRQPDPGAADADQADPLVRPVAEPAPQRRPVGQLGRVEAGHVPGEVEVLLGPRRGSTAARARSRPGRRRRGRRRRPTGRAAPATGPAARASRRCSRRSAPPPRSPPAGIGSQPTKSVSQAYAVDFSSGFSCRKWSTSQASSPITRS